MPVRYTLAWFLLLVAALVNAFLREGVYKNALGELRAHQLSTFTALVLFGVINRRDGSAWGMFWSSLVFSAWHQPLLQGLMFGWELGLVQLVVRTISGALYCWLRIRTGGLVAPFFAHCTHNMFVSVRLLARGAETL